MAAQSQNPNMVFGKVSDNSGKTLANLKVVIYDKDMRSEELLAETVTLKDGTYKTTWLHSQLSGRGKKEADILVKVFTREKETLLFSSNINQVRFNASPKEEINIIIKNPIKNEIIEYDYLLKEVTFLAGKIPVAEFQETKEQPDVTFLYKELETDASKINYLIIANRLEKKIRIDAPFFYALLSKNTLLKNLQSEVITKPLFIDIDTDIQSVLYLAALADPKVIQSDVREAAEGLIVNKETVKKTKQNLEILQQYKKEAGYYFENEHPKKAFEKVSNFIQSGKIKQVSQLFEENKNDLSSFFSKLEDFSFSDKEDKSQEDKTIKELQKIVGFGNEMMPLIIKSKKITKPEDIKKLARLNKSEWVTELTAAKGKKITKEDKNNINLFASNIVRRLENQFPTTAFTAQLAREKKQLFANQKSILAFLNKNEDFDLKEDNIEHYIKQKKIPRKESEAVKEELKSVQRIFKLVPNYTKTNALRGEELNSAQGIASVGKTRFTKEIAPKVGLSEKEANLIFRKAENINTTAMLIAGELQDTMRAMDISSLETASLAKKLEAVSKDFPNLKSLFKLSDNCACEHCRSVYSPAAYLVEILEFLSKRTVRDTISNTTSNLAKDELFKRRPDLGEIDLGCENANTPVKYIDLVCEILEEAIAPGVHFEYSGNLSDGSNPVEGIISADLLASIQNAQTELTDITTGDPVFVPADYEITNQALVIDTGIFEGAKPVYYLRDKKIVFKIVYEQTISGVKQYKIYRLKQTFGTAEELDAAPEYVNITAYHELQKNAFAFQLPFDLNHTEAKAYFNRFGLNRGDLMKTFQVVTVPHEAIIATEKLGLNDSERKLISAAPSPNNNAAQQLYWNVPAPGNVVNYLKEVDHFLVKTNLSFDQLDLLLKLNFIDKNANLFIKHNYDDLLPGETELTISCDTAKKEIANLDLAALDRIHRFLRLQKKTGLKLELLDEIISQSKLGRGKLDANDDNSNGITNGEECLIVLSVLFEIASKTGLKIDQLVGFYGEIPHEIITDNLPKPLYYQVFLNKAKNGFIDNGLKPENVDTGQPISNVKTSIAVCLQIKEEELDQLLILLSNQEVSFSNLSYLYAATQLAKKLKLKISDFIILRELFDIDFNASPQATLDFITSVFDFKKSPLKAAEVKYMLWHQAPEVPNIDDKRKQILEKLQKEYQVVIDSNKSPFDASLNADEQKEAVKTTLEKLPVISEDDTKIITGFIDSSWSFKWINEAGAEVSSTDFAGADLYLTTKLASYFNVNSITAFFSSLNTANSNLILANTNQSSAIAAIELAQQAVAEATNPGDLASAQAQLLIAQANETATSLAVKNIQDAFEAIRKNLVKEILDVVSAFNVADGKRNALELNLSTAFKADSELIKVILKYAQLKKSAPGNEFLEAILLADDLNIKIGLPPALPAITITTPAKQHAALNLLNKILPLISVFKLNNVQIEWFFQNSKDLDWFAFDNIPFAAAQTRVSYSEYSNFISIIDLLSQFDPVINPSDPEVPISMLGLLKDFGKLSTVTAAQKSQFLEKLALLLNFDKQELQILDSFLFPGTANVKHYNVAKTWYRVLDCIQCLLKLSVKVSQITAYLKPVLNAIDVANLRTALKSRYDEDTWLETLKEIMNSIRPQKRNALVAYLLAVNEEMKDENDLFDYFLVDVEMESCMPSSRIVQAHNAIQVFVQRCLMGLEPKAAADLETDVNWNQWKWMKNYRVWEANRKIFLYPENWIEPELRDDKTYLFKEFENELQQSELTDFSAEQALANYLEKLDAIAFLEVVASYYQTDIKTMHVFARSKGGDPYIYYYRKLEKELSWTPWEKVELDITGDHLTAFVRNNRLCLAWPIFSDELDPSPQATMPTENPGEKVTMDKSKRKLKIQLAVSELANTKWQPKKVSTDSILTPNSYTDDEDDLRRDVYYLTYFALPKINNFPISDVICLFKQAPQNSEGPQTLNGIFSIAGCKGYPELIFKDSIQVGFPDFLPDFNDTQFLKNKYAEQNQDAPNDDLSVVNGVTVFKPGSPYSMLLRQTPGNFRISYPHQFTKIDFVSLIFQLLSNLVNNSAQMNNMSSYSGHTKRYRFKIPMGTLLPYFKENSHHAYVIIPGYYKQGDIRNYTDDDFFTDSDKRTATDVLMLIDDIQNFFNKLKLKHDAIPTPPPVDYVAFVHEMILDQEFTSITERLGAYEQFDTAYAFMIGIINNSEIDTVLQQIKAKNGLVYGEQFKNMYHPLVCPLRAAFYNKGIPELMKRETQMKKTGFDFKSYYVPNPLMIPTSLTPFPDGSQKWSYPIEDVDFSPEGSYSCYNWELFFHVPLMIAVKLTQNQRFEESMTWFHYMFNPTGALSGSTPQKYWVTKPFYLNQDEHYNEQRIDNLLFKNASSGTAEKAIMEWREKPFMPDVIARKRPVAYQKTLLMKYLDNLIEWGDYLFRQDTMESVAQATQMYIIGDKVLGPKPLTVPPVVKPSYQTYNQIKGKLDSFGNALIDLENLIPEFELLPEGGAELPPSPVTLSMLYFCIPENDKMLEYWAKIADRLFKIRHCQNIDGVERSLALFAPPIDPAMLVRAAASGMDISSVIAGLNAPTPFYRFNVLSQKSTELAQEVRGLGNSLLSALEKKDGEAMSLLRNQLEMKVLNSVRDIKTLQIREAAEQIEVLKRTKKVTEERHKYYQEIEYMNALETTTLILNGVSIIGFTVGSIMELTAGATALVPDVTVGAAGIGGSPLATSKLTGGEQISSSISTFAKAILLGSQVVDKVAAGISTMGSYERRNDDWKLQERLAEKEISSIEKQISAAELRKEISETDLRNHDIQIENAKKTDEFMRSKFTNKELYDWMIGQISSVYFSAYKLSHDFAKKAERSYKFELGNDDSFISYGYWDSKKKGLQSADRLIHDIKRMETSYLDKNKREYEITKNVSLAMLDPLALIRLKATGICDFEIPEVLYDMDHSGQYFRRLKSVSISLPCIAGPYTSVSAKLSLVNNRYRKNTEDAANYAEDIMAGDNRFVYNVGSIQSIAISNAQSDSGVFELNFRDDRYLPFEGTGAISGWRLELPTEVRQFDYNTISDVILHVKYTAREGGSSLKTAANTTLKDQLELIKQGLNRNGLHIALNLKHDKTNEWHLLKKNGTVDLTIDKFRLPYMAQPFDSVEIENVIFVAKVTGNPVSFTIKINDAPLNLSRADELKLCKGISSNIDLDTPFTLSVSEDDKEFLEEIVMIVKYKF
ncbi:neuraminidase-like domain-containing protein [Flavobacterium humidisoli]|uniref:Neuraminidase-like domain-containing protein n=1 Tax=Flavobacterium humidisoli TaxID=2937442 RepID=A0ABY4LTF0_9FLAO|nr:neuraminidase-like domain-containing protein [Flavobacterium humidisoli]UPZ15121.1 neuraminidase-like domain-containing protein [Flavobacterium humidisoli]